MLEPCPFCAQPIAREYGTFRCKSCAKSSEDMIDLERKARATEIRKAQRAARTRTADASTSSPAPDAKRRALALAIARHAARKKESALVPAGAGKKTSKRSA